MKMLLAFSAFWIAFYLADQALYDGLHIGMIGRFLTAIAVGFGFQVG